MVPVVLRTLIVLTPPSPSVIVLQPEEEAVQPGKYRIVPIWIGMYETSQLSCALEGTKFERPMTHDLFLNALTNLDSCVDHVLINDVKGTVFYARLVLRHQGRIVELDARPSDAISLAVRQEAPIYIDEEVLERASFPYVAKHPLSEADQEAEIAEFRTFLEDIAPEDFES